jgi:GT2 family glycosyltransferase
MTDPLTIDHPKSLAAPVSPRPVHDDISIVIPTLGRPILETCLRYLVDGSSWPATVIVVDQGRDPAVRRMLDRVEELGLPGQYVPSTQRGRSAGINRGLERVSTRFLAITDDDCFVAADWLDRMIERLHRAPETIVTGRVELAGDDVVPFSVVTSMESELYTRPQLTVHPFIGGNVGLALSRVARIGAFDEHPCLASAEDSDYGHRALRLGIPIAYHPEIVLYHYHWRDAGERASRYADYARSQGGFFGTHIRRGDRLVFLQALRALARSPVRWLRGILRRDREMIENGRASTLNLLPGLVAGLRRGRSSAPSLLLRTSPRHDHADRDG